MSYKNYTQQQTTCLWQQQASAPGMKPRALARAAGMETDKTMKTNLRSFFTPLAVTPAVRFLIPLYESHFTTDN